MSRYGMLIDLKKCVGCNACVVACKSEHNAPNGILHTMVLESERGTFPNAIRVFVPVLCNHCDQPSCLDVCPSGATHRREDGIVMIDYDKCIGCCACIEHCPYQVRELVMDDRTLYPDGETVFEKPVAQKIRNNVVVKCDFCYHRVEKGVQPACCEVCPPQARIFGDLSDPASKVSEMCQSGGVWQMSPDEGTTPCVYYKG